MDFVIHIAATHDPEAPWSVHVTENGRLVSTGLTFQERDAAEIHAVAYASAFRICGRSYTIESDPDLTHLKGSRS